MFGVFHFVDNVCVCLCLCDCMHTVDYKVNYKIRILEIVIHILTHSFAATIFKSQTVRRQWLACVWVYVEMWAISLCVYVHIEVGRTTGNWVRSILPNIRGNWRQKWKLNFFARFLIVCQCISVSFNEIILNIQDFIVWFMFFCYIVWLNIFFFYTKSCVYPTLIPIRKIAACQTD